MRRPRRLTQGSRVQKWFCFALFFPTHLMTPMTHPGHHLIIITPSVMMVMMVMMMVS